MTWTASFAASPDFVRNNCEALARITCSCSLNSRVECKNVGLERNIVDEFRDRLDLLGSFSYVLDSAAEVLHVLIAYADIIHGLFRQSPHAVCHLRVCIYIFVYVLNESIKLL